MSIKRSKIKNLADERVRIFWEEIVPATGIEPTPFNWFEIAAVIAFQHADQMKVEKRGRKPSKSEKIKDKEEYKTAARKEFLWLIKIARNYHKCGNVTEAVGMTPGIEFRTYQDLATKHKPNWDDMKESEEFVDEIEFHLTYFDGDGKVLPEHRDIPFLIEVEEHIQKSKK